MQAAPLDTHIDDLNQAYATNHTPPIRDMKLKTLL